MPTANAEGLDRIGGQASERSRVRSVPVCVQTGTGPRPIAVGMLRDAEKKIGAARLLSKAEHEAISSRHAVVSAPSTDGDRTTIVPLAVGKDEPFGLLQVPSNFP